MVGYGQDFGHELVSVSEADSDTRFFKTSDMDSDKVSISDKGSETDSDDEKVKTSDSDTDSVRRVRSPLNLTIFFNSHPFLIYHA